MALPHYKLQTEALPDAPVSFPVLLAPAESPARFALVKRMFRSRAFLLFLQIVSIAAGASLLWMWLDPTIKTPKPLYVAIPAATLGLCVLLFTLAGIIKNKTEESVPERVDEIPVISASVVKPLVVMQPIATANKTEVNFEEWVSEPFQEIIDESLIAEVFDDELIAPDRMVFSVTVTD